MKLSTRARYALRMMLDVARNGGDERPVSLSSVAERSGLSRGYLEQLALALRASRLLRGVPGRHGGYRLARSAADITVGNVVEATIGPVNIVPCLEDADFCLRHSTCECRMVYTLINYRVTEVLHGYTLADLLDSSWIESFGSRLDALPRLPVPLSDGKRTRRHRKKGASKPS